MKIYGIARSHINLKDDADYAQPDVELRGLRFEDKVRKMGLFVATDESTGEEYVGIIPMYPWDNAQHIDDIDTVGKAKRFIGRQLMRIATNELDDLKAHIGFVDK
ncbi:MAG: hypothetical protein II178_09405 [Selenomonadaceae bacterium]|nr:hypothetical protein [Selenomonadaceae bacterium]MBQ1915418.1 hypothetical protein [Selenomonadaceae bacterium]MBQ3971210.1 hypothetical protein [Selenomonadaceae bacterium]